MSYNKIKVGTAEPNRAGEISPDLSDLNNVSSATPTSGQYLKYNSTSTDWEPGTLTASPTITTVSPGTDYTISTKSGVEEVFLITPAANINVNLPAAATAGTGYKYQIKNLSSSYSLTIDANSTETIDAVATVSITQQYASLTLLCDGSNWFII